MSLKSGWCLSYGQIHHDRCPEDFYLSDRKQWVKCTCDCGHKKLTEEEVRKKVEQMISTTPSKATSTPSPKPKLRKRSKKITRRAVN